YWVLQIRVPGIMYHARNMPGVVKEYIFVRLNNSDPFVFEVLLEPICFYQRFWMRVLNRMRSHRKKTFRLLSETSKGFYNLVSEGNRQAPPAMGRFRFPNAFSLATALSRRA